MKSKKILFLILFSFLYSSVAAQDIVIREDDEEASPNLKISGYLQPEWQLGEEASQLNVGKPNQIDDQGELFNRVGLRRGRIKFSYEDGGLGAAGLQFNIVDKPGLAGAQVQLRDLYFKLKAPWNKSSLVQVGMFGRPFGFELNYSSSSRESPERSKVIASLFPGRSDLGAMIVLRPEEHSPLHFLTFRGGLFAGNGINPETDNRKDFIGQLTASKSIGNVHVGLGVSYYNGGIFQTNDSIYTMNGNIFSLNDNPGNRGGYAKREYIGFDAQFNYRSSFGLTQLRGEFVFGTQPGTATHTNSPSRAILPSYEDTYIRPFAGGYVMLVQNVGKSPLSAVLKFESFNPNTAVSRNAVGAITSFTGIADIQYSIVGIGVNWQVTSRVRTTLYYDMVTNETSTMLSSADYRRDYVSDRKDNVFTCRVQYKF